MVPSTASECDFHLKFTLDLQDSTGFTAVPPAPAPVAAPASAPFPWLLWRILDVFLSLLLYVPSLHWWQANSPSAI